MKSGSINFLEPSGPILVCNGAAFTTTTIIIIIIIIIIT